MTNDQLDFQQLLQALLAFMGKRVMATVSLTADFGDAIPIVTLGGRLSTGTDLDAATLAELEVRPDSAGEHIILGIGTRDSPGLLTLTQQTFQSAHRFEGTLNDLDVHGLHVHLKSVTITISTSQPLS